MLRGIILAGLIGITGLLSTAQAEIFADVTLSGGVTGTFRITLEDTKAPVAVANFIGLATGKNGWIDPVTGRLRYDPFYNGLTFHRVIAGFVSQTGSRSGNGTDGPGYTFANEIDGTPPTPLTHATPYTVAMANSGGDFFEWIAVLHHHADFRGFLDGSYTIFGRVTSGTAVCDALNAVATNGPSGIPEYKPNTDVTISSIVFGGTSLAAFNLQPSGLPRVTSAKPVLKINGASYALGYDHLPFSAYFASNSANLVAWNQFINGPYFHNQAPAAGDLDVTSFSAGARQFFQMPRVDYSQAYNPIRPENLANRSFSFPGFAGRQQFQLNFNASGNGGTYAYNFTGQGTQTGNLFAVNYIQLQVGVGAYTPYLYVILQTSANTDDNLLMIFEKLDYSSASSGNRFTFHGTVSQFPANLSYTTGSFSSNP